MRTGERASRLEGAYARLRDVDARTLSLARQFSLWIGPKGTADWNTSDLVLESIHHRFDVFTRNFLGGVALILAALVITTFVQ